MTIENATYISELLPGYPERDAKRHEGDDHIRLIKRVVKNSFPNVDAAVNPDPDEFNLLSSVDTAGTLGFLSTLGVLTAIFGYSRKDLGSTAAVGIDFDETIFTLSKGNADTTVTLSNCAEGRWAVWRHEVIGISDRSLTIAGVTTVRYVPSGAKVLLLPASSRGVWLFVGITATEILALALHKESMY